MVNILIQCCHDYYQDFISFKYFYLFMTPVKQESAVLANDEPHFKCVQFHLPVFAMFVSRINFDFLKPGWR